MKKLEEKEDVGSDTCTVQELLKLMSGKWKPEIFHLASMGSVRFSSLLRQLDGASKQAVASVLREFEASGILAKDIVQEKPLHIEYRLTERGKSLVPIFQQLEQLV